MKNPREGNAPTDSGSSSAKWRILCVDDEPDILTVLRAALSPHYEVVTAQSGFEALKILDLCEPDFVICDLRMPGMDGFATVKAIRSSETYADIPVFFLTAETSRDAARRGFEVGCNLYLTKPFDAGRLIDNIDYFTRESGHTARSKSHTLSAVAGAIEQARRAPGPPPPPKRKPPAVEPVTPQEQPVVSSTQSRSDAEIRAERDALLADRKARQREYWKKRYAEMQAFIDEHMK